MNPNLDLTLGGLSLTGRDSTVDYTIEALAEGGSWGAPQPVDVAIQTLLQQGSLVVTERYENREVTLRVIVSAPDGISLAQGEAALFAECGKPNTLTWTPPAAFAPTTVFQVVTSSLAPEFDDLDELMTQRVYALTLVCKPFTYSDSTVTVQALNASGGGTPPALVDTLVDDCTSATGWTAVGSGQSVTVVSGAVKSGPANQAPTLKRTGTIDMTSTPLLVVDVKMSESGVVPVAFFNGSTSAVSPSGKEASATNAGYTRYYFLSPVTSITSFTVARPTPPPSRPQPHPDGTISIAEVRKRNNPPASGTLRQKFFTAAVSGGAPTEGTLMVSTQSGGNLGTAIVYTWSNDEGQQFVPALRTTFDIGNPGTADSTTVSGAYTDIASASVRAVVPIDNIPTGTYELGAMLRSSTAATKTLTITIDHSPSLSGSTTFTVPVTFSTIGTLNYYPLARIQLPLARVTPPSSISLRVAISGSGTGTLHVDDVYLFNRDSGDLTIADCSSYARLQLVPASIDWPAPAVLFGGAADGSAATSQGALVSAWDIHEVKPTVLNAFVVTTGASSVDPNVQLTYTPAHPTHATL